MPLSRRDGNGPLRTLLQRRVKLLAALLAVLLALLIAATWLFAIQLLDQQREVHIAAAHRETANMAKALDEHIVRTFLAADSVLLNIKGRIESAPRPLEQADLDEMLRTQKPILTVVAAADADGWISDSAPASSRVSVADREIFRAHIERDSGTLFVGPPIIGRVSGKWSINISRRINRADGSFAGVVIAGIDIEYFDRFYKEVDLGTDSLISVIGRDGIVRLRRTADGFSAGQTVRESPPVKRVAGGEKKGSLVLVVPTESKRRIASFRALEQLPLVVVVAKSEAEVLREYMQSRKTYFAVCGVLTLMLLLVGALAALALRAYRASAAAKLEKDARRYLTALNSSGLALWEWDVQKDALYVNALWPAMLGAPAEAQVMSIADLRANVHPDDVNHVRTSAIRVLKDEQQHLDLDYRLRTQSGGWLWCQCRGTVLERDAAGRALRLVGTQCDISARKQAEDALRLSEDRFRSTFDQASVGITVVSPDNRYLQVNDKYCVISGYSRDELLSMGIEDINLPENLPETLELRRQLLAGEIDVVYRDKPIVRKDGSLVWISLATSVVRAKDGTALHFISIVQDVSETKNALAALRESEEQFHQFADNLPQMLWMTDPAGRDTVYASPSVLRLLGVDAAGRPRSLIRAVHPDDRRRVRDARRRAAEGHYDEIYRVRCVDGRLRWLHDRAFPVRDDQGNIVRIAGVAEDITDRRLAEERIAYASLYDALTSLPNRVQFHQRITEALNEVTAQGVAVLLIDADHFKKINDTLGHASGDELLKQLTERLLQTVRPDDVVARMGGDEFAVLFKSSPGVEHVERVATLILEAMRQPCQFEGEDVHLGISIGIAMAGGDGTDADTLLRNADAAMYSAKNAGRNTYRLYKPEMTLRTVELLKLENSLRRAIDREEFSLYYQPKARIVGGQVVGFEALLRWRHPTRGLVSPAEIIPILEETGLIVPVGEWVIREVCSQLRIWEKHGMGNFPVAINVSARQFSEPGFAARVKRILDEEIIDPRMIELEITESVLMAGAEDAVATLQTLKLLGISISVDDFGTGYSSLSYLKRFPLDALKIDRSFVRDVPGDLDDAAITRTIISMAHGLRLKVIAEGVERPEQMRFLADHGCDFIQGYLLSKPQPAKVWTEKYGRDPLLVSQKIYLRVAKETRLGKE